MAVNDIWSFKITCFGMSQLGEIVLHALETTTLGTGGTVQQGSDSVSTAFATVIKAWMSPTFSYRGVIGQRIFPLANKSNPINSVAGQGAGAAAAGDLPTQLAGLLTFRSNLVGRRGLGRGYVPFPATAQFTGTGAILSAAGLTALGNIATVLLAPLTFGTGGNTSTIVFGVYSKKFGQIGTIIQVPTHASFATQRRRGAFGKVNAQPF